MTQEEAYQRLELPGDTDIQEVRRKFAAMHSDYRMRIDNAPTPRLRQLFEQQLEQIKEAYSLLNGSEGMNDTIDLPRTKRVVYDDNAREKESTAAKPGNSSQYNLLDAYDYFGLSPEDDKEIFNRLTKKKLEELKTSWQSQSLPSAKKLYEEELAKAEKLNALLLVDRQAKEALARKIAGKREQERLAKERAEKERLAKEKEEQERVAREKAEQERRALAQAEQERLEKAKAEKEHLAQEKERIAKEKAVQERLAKESAAKEKAEREREKAEKRQAGGAQEEHAPGKSKGKPILIIGLLVIIIGALAFYFLKPGQENPSAPELMEQNGLYGYQKGERIIIAPRFESAEAFKDGQAKVRVHDSVFYIDETGTLTRLIEVKIDKAEAEKQKRAEKDRTAWELAAASGSKPAYESYLQLYPEGQYVAEAKMKIAALEKQEAATKQNTAAAKRSNANIDMAQYNEDLSWAKKMVAVDGCEGCRTNPICKSQVIERLKKALKSNPDGPEAKSLLQCLTR